jgi:Ca2+-binding EF-hand superfamily protein
MFMARAMGLLCTVMAVGLFLGSAGGQEQKKGNFDIDAIFKKLDTNNDGKLSKEEFLKLAERFKDKEKARAKLVKAFEQFDTEKMGLTKAQFQKYVESVKKKDQTP